MAETCEPVMNGEYPNFCPVYCPPDGMHKFCPGPTNLETGKIEIMKLPIHTWFEQKCEAEQLVEDDSGMFQGSKNLDGACCAGLDLIPPHANANRTTLWPDNAVPTYRYTSSISVLGFSPVEGSR